jgi:hypothetical protein
MVTALRTILGGQQAMAISPSRHQGQGSDEPPTSVKGINRRRSRYFMIYIQARRVTLV